MEENKQKNNAGLLIIIASLIVVCIGLCGFIFMNRNNLFNTNKPKENKTEEKEKKNLELTDDVKTKLNRFVEVGSEDSYGSVQTAPFFYNGKSEILESEKLIMAYVDAVKISKKTEYRVLTEEEIQNIDGLKPETNEKVTILKVSDFEQSYKDLFDEDGDYKKLKDLGVKIGCPAPLGMDANAGNMYLYSRCGGTTNVKYSKEITSYDSDTEYYYVHQTMKYESQEETKEYKVVWKFDKNIKFISTEKED